MSLFARLAKFKLPMTRGADLVLAAVVVGIIGMMILPLPTWLIDILITFNITIAVVLLLASTYVTEALHISSFPTILLLTTLFRLALNISSTRLILLQADAGDVINAFGNFVVGGNYVVGAVIFILLTLIQFIVIAKGSERVAEVGARFTLDAMPGKQMSIDADVRAGVLDAGEARARRRHLQRESELYGAMDGAMKFVKGDAIAGILIAVVNIVGGLIIGVMQRGMPMGEAARVYTLLTIGDGLVSQIPALLITVAAGLIVTRVASEEAGRGLATEIGVQLFSHPKALGIASALLVGLAIVPGMPAIPFLILGTGAGAAAVSIARRQAQVTASDRTAVAQGRAADPSGRSDQYAPLVTPILVELAADLAARLESEGGVDAILGTRVPTLRDEIFRDLGLRIPAVRMAVQSGLPTGTYRLSLYEVPVGDGTISPGHVFIAAAPEALPPLANPPTSATHPGTGRAGAWVDVATEAPLRAAGAPVLDATQYILEHLGAVARRRAADFLGIEEVQQLLDHAERHYPAAVREVVPKLVSLFRLTDVLRRLLDERVSIRDMRAILNALADYAQNEKDPAMLAEYVRTALKRAITHRFSAPDGSLPVYLLDPEIEEALRGAIQKTPVGHYLALDPAASSEILAALRGVFAARPAVARPPVIVTNMEIRRFFRRLIEVEFPEAVVLAYHELSSDVSLQPLARVRLREEAAI